MDESSPIDILKEMAVRFRDEREWKQFHTIRNLAMGLAIEAAELQELFLWKSDHEAQTLLEDGAARQRLKEEMADIFIYLLYMSNDCGIDLSEAVMEKIAMNGKKYPVEKSRGSSKKYDEL